MSKLSKAIANAIIEFNSGLLTQDELYQKLERDIDNVSVKVWREDKSVPLPTYGKEGDACCNVYAKSIEYDADKDRFIIHTGLHFALPDDMGYEVTYPDGYKSWTPKDVADAAYYPLSENNDGTKILKEDVENFITNVEVMTVGEKTTIVNVHTLTGFDTVRHSSCVDPKNYSEELGKQYAMEEVVNDLWAHLGFVLQWAKYGINSK